MTPWKPLETEMHFHAQNLNEDRDGKVKGSMLWHGRCWLGKARACWKIPCRHVGISFSKDDEEYTVHVGILLASLWLGWQSYGVRKDREFSIRFFDGAMWLALWRDPMESRGDDPWWKRDYRIAPLDILFGRHRYSTATVKEADALVPMPEGSYPAKVKLHDDTWKRPRLPFVRRTIRRVTIDLPLGIPHMGKGENSWDCGEDGTWGLTTTADSIEQGIGKLVASVLETRRRHGTPDRIKPAMASAEAAAS